MNERRHSSSGSCGISRRLFLGAGFVAGVSLVLPLRARAWERPKALGAAIRKSPLVYVTPLRSSGSESRCHAEVWFVADGADLLVVTTSERWRAAAIARGLGTARLWVGDYGVWKKAEGRYREAPSCVAQARLDPDPVVHARALQAFGSKYAASGWAKWEQRFKDGLASGERVMIRYTPSAA